MKLINKISLFLICFLSTNTMLGQDAYLGDPDPGSNAPPFHSPNRPSVYDHPNDDANSESMRLKKYKEGNASHNPLNEITKKYYLNIYNEELIKFKNCIKSEGLIESDLANTKCEISKAIQDATFILKSKKDLHAIDLLDKYTKFKKIKNRTPRYPKNMLEFGETGYVVIEFDITEKGKVVNEEIIEGWCGNVSSPYTDFQPCSFFNREALTALVKFKYKPAKINNKPIYIRGVKHKFTFSLRPKLSKMKDEVDKAYDNVRNNIINKNYNQAVSIAQSYLEYDDIFYFEKARAHFFNEEYTEASASLFTFIESLDGKKYRYPEEVLLSSLIILVDSLYYAEEFKKIINLDKNISNYVKQKPKFRRNLAMTSLYLGTAYVNTGDIQKGIYHLSIARKYAPSDQQIQYIDNVINQVSNYF